MRLFDTCKDKRKSVSRVYGDDIVDNTQQQRPRWTVCSECKFIRVVCPNTLNLALDQERLQNTSLTSIHKNLKMWCCSRKHN